MKCAISLKCFTVLKNMHVKQCFIVEAPLLKPEISLKRIPSQGLNGWFK